MNAGLMIMLLGAAMMFVGPAIRTMEARHPVERIKDTAPPR